MKIIDSEEQKEMLKNELEMLYRAKEHSKFPQVYGFYENIKHISGLGQSGKYV
jgi:hypothetical protein